MCSFPRRVIPKTLKTFSLGVQHKRLEQSNNVQARMCVPSEPL